MLRLPRVLVLAAALAALAASAHAQPKFDGIYPRRGDVKYIKCDVCNLLAGHIFDDAYKLADDWLKVQGKKVTEDAVIDRIEPCTTAWRQEGEWITRYHLVKSLTGSRLVVKDMGKPGVCGEACKTIERAAQDTLQEYDADIGEAVYVKKYPTKKAFAKWMCESLTGVCPSAAGALPSGHPAYPPFKPKAAEEPNMERMMGEMKDAGLKGQMWSREELMEKYGDELGADADGHDLGAGIGGPGGDAAAAAAAAAAEKVEL